LLEGKWKLLAICSIIFSIGHALRVLISPYLGVLQDALSLSYAQTVFLYSSYDIGYVAGLFSIFFFGGMRVVGRGVMVVPLIYLLGLISSFYSSSFLELFISRFILGFATGIYLTHGLDLLSYVFHREERGKMMGYHSIGSSVGRLYGSLIGGFISSIFGWREPFLLLAIISSLIAIPSLLKLKDVKIEVSSVRYKRLKKILPHILIYGIAFFFFLSSVSLFPLYFSNVIGLGSDVIGVLLAIVTLTTIVANPIIGVLSDRYEKRKVISALLLICTFLAIYLPHVENVWEAVFFSVILGVTVTSPIQIMLAIITYVASEEERSSAIGYFNGTTFLLSLIILNLFGKLIEFLGLKLVITLIGAVTLFGVFFTLRFLRD